jgi:halogenation protein CepH
MLGIAEELENQHFVRKLGGTFRWGKSKEPWSFTFADSSRFGGSASYAYQVERTKFDAILLNNARRKGVDVLEQHRVADLIVDNGRVSGVKLVDNAGAERVVKSKYVVDASGHNSTISRHAGERIFSKCFRNIAVFGYFLNAGRLPAPNSGNIFTAAFDKGWFWYIPLSDTLTSVGAVIGQEYSSLLHQGLEPALHQLIESCEPIRKLLAGATQCSDAPYNEIRARKDYSYCNTSFWKPGLVLIGDAACFVDPVFSSGVHLATYSALLAAKSINSSLEKQLDEAAAFATFEVRYRREYRYFYDFLSAFYELNQDLEGYYWAARTAVNAEERRDHAFLNLVGGDASGEMLHNLQSSPASRVRQALLLFPNAAEASAEMYDDNSNHTGEGSPIWSDHIAEESQLQLTSDPSMFYSGETASV